MPKKICYPKTAIPIVTGNLQLDSTRVKTRKKKVLVPGQASAVGPTQIPFGPQLPPAKLPAPASVLPVDNGAGKTVVITHTPALTPRIRYEDSEGTVTRHHIGKGVSLAPKPLPVAHRTRIHPAHRGVGSTRRHDR